MKKYFFILLVLTLCLTGCGMSKEEKEKAQEYIEKYSDDFKKQAKKQYGNDAKVTDISTVLNETYGSIWPTLDIYTTENLEGTITIKNETFKGIYYSGKGIIYSTKNNESIRRSVYEYFRDLNIDILDVYILYAPDSTTEYCLPDNIINLKDFFQVDTNSIYMHIYLFTTSNISNINEEYFENYINDNQEKNVVLTVVELKDNSMLYSLKKELRQGHINFNTSYDTVYDYDTHDYVYSFEKYNIMRSIYIYHNEFDYEKNLVSACPYENIDINLLNKYDYLDKTIIPNLGVITDVVDYDDYFSLTIECTDLLRTKYYDIIRANGYVYDQKERLYINNDKNLKFKLEDDSRNYRAVISVYKIKE